jgi:hypothetical protein
MKKLIWLIALAAIATVALGQGLDPGQDTTVTITAPEVLPTDTTNPLTWIIWVQYNWDSILGIFWTFLFGIHLLLRMIPTSKKLEHIAVDRKDA